VLAYRVRESYLDRTRETLAREAVLISASLKADLQRGDVSAVESAPRRLGEILKCRVTIIEDDGRVIGDNEADPAQDGEPSPARRGSAGGHLMVMGLRSEAAVR